MRTVLTLTVAVAISLSTLVALEWSSTRAPLPAGEVTIMQIEEPTQVAPLAQADVDAQGVRTASRSL
jgi:hypothetical protein